MQGCHNHTTVNRSGLNLHITYLRRLLSNYFWTFSTLWSHIIIIQIRLIFRNVSLPLVHNTLEIIRTKTLTFNQMTPEIFSLNTEWTRFLGILIRITTAGDNRQHCMYEDETINKKQTDLSPSTFLPSKWRGKWGFRFALNGAVNESLKLTPERSIQGYLDLCNMCILEFGVFGMLSRLRLVSSFTGLIAEFCIPARCSGSPDF